MVNFEQLRAAMDAAGLDGLLTVDSRNNTYVTGLLELEMWLRDVQDLTNMVSVVSFPDKSFVIGAQGQFPNFPGTSYWCDQTFAVRVEMAADQLKARGLHQARLGMDMHYVPVSAMRQLQALLPEVEFVAADDILYSLRSMKNEEELANVKTAIEISQNAFLAIQPTLKEGSRVQDIAYTWAKEVIDHGGLPLCFIPFDFFSQRVTPIPDGFKRKHHWIDRLPTQLERGVVTRLDVCVLHKGYWSDQKIVICVGKPSPEAIALYNEHRARQEFMVELLKPGMSKGEAYQACMKEFKNIEEYCFWIHGVGLDVHEEPRIGSLMDRSPEVNQGVKFEANQTLALEASWLVEDTYLLTDNGCVRLGSLPQEIIQL